MELFEYIVNLDTKNYIKVRSERPFILRTQFDSADALLKMIIILSELRIAQLGL